MCRSAVDIHSATAEIRRGKKKEETTGQKYNLLICYTQGGHKKDRTEKVTKGLYFTYLGRSPHWSDLHQKLCSKWSPRRNHVCQVSKWNFQGYDFAGGSNFPFSYWYLNVPYNSAALCAACDCTESSNRVATEYYIFYWDIFSAA